MSTDRLPPGLVAYRRTPVFTEDTLPAGLRRDHSTKAGVWALIHVLEGRLLYRKRAPNSEEIVTPGHPAVVVPGQLHEVEPLGPVRIFVEFFAATPPAGGPHAQQPS